jgi:hypothetical protein
MPAIVRRFYEIFEAALRAASLRFSQVNDGVSTPRHLVQRREENFTEDDQEIGVRMREWNR